MPGFYRASTPTFKVTPVGYSVSSLGTPAMFLSQGEVYTDLECTVNAASNSVTATLSYEDSLRYVPDIPATLQVVWTDSNDNVVAFPEHQLNVLQTHVEFIYDEE